MSMLADSLVSASARPLHLRMRPDLIVRRQFYQGVRSWAIKEPLGQGYFRFKEEDFAVLEMLDGESSLEGIKERFEARFPQLQITHEQLWQFVSSLHRSNLMTSDAPQQGGQLKKRRDERRRKELLGKFSNVLAVRFRGFDPERLLNLIYPWVRWLFSPAAVVACLLLALVALLLITVQFDVFHSRLPSFHQFFGLRNAVWLIVALAFSKVLHEFGHGLTCKHFGGECHEMGVMFLVLTPCLYCNVSDSWMLPSKWQRAAIGAAGMYVEVTLASLCTLIWWFSEPGFLNQLCLYVMFICSVSTIVFNGNPLLRFDGYYILSDLMEIPNLRQKSTTVLQRTLAWWCLGLEPPLDRYLPPRQRLFFIAYSLAAAVYRWVVVLLILWFLFQVFKPYRLQIIGQLIAAMAIFGLVVMPLWKVAKFFYVPGRLEQVKKKRLFATLGGLAAVLAAIVLVPLPHHVICPVEIRAHGAMPVYVTVPGNLQVVHRLAGKSVEAEAPLAELTNIDLDVVIAQLKNQRNLQQLQLKDLKRQRFHSTEKLAHIPEIESALKSSKEQLARRLVDRQSLMLMAPCVGTILPPPTVAEKTSHGRGLATWSGTPLAEKNLGCYLERQTLFCLVGDPKDLKAVLVVDQSDIDFVREGSVVDIKLDQLADENLRGSIQSISKTEMQASSPQLSNKTGGELATESDDSGRERPQSISYQARVVLVDVEAPLRLGLRGRAKIHAGHRTLGQRFWRFLAQTFRYGS